MPVLRNAVAMSALLRALSAEPPEPLSAEEGKALNDNASLLRDALQAGRTQSLLRDKFIGLLADRDDTDQAELFKSAAVALGARVAHIRPSLTERSDPRVVRETARMLSRLYDAIECQGQPAPLVQRLRDESKVPVFESLAAPTSVATALAERLGADRDVEGRRFVVQVMLLSTIH